MPKTIPQDDPKLLMAVDRLKRVHMLWGWLLIGLGALTQLSAGMDHAVAGLPFIAAGAACLYWREPALLAVVATLVALSMVSSINGYTPILGPDPIVRLLALSTVERWALVIAKFLVVLTAANQFFFYRLLYGTERATSDDPDLPIIPPMVPNRTDGLARSARWMAYAGAAAVILSLLLMRLDPAAFLTRLLSEMGGSLGAVALGLGLGCAFSPTDERESALWGVSVGLVSFIGAALALMQMA